MYIVYSFYVILSLQLKYLTAVESWRARELESWRARELES